MSLADAIIREMGNRGFRFIEADEEGLNFKGMGNGKTVVIDATGKSEADIPELVKAAEARILNGRIINNG